jgi:hypothetical protein
MHREIPDPADRQHCECPVIVVQGRKTLFRKLGAVAFNCPTCRQLVQGARERPRRWCTLYFVPVIPLRKGEIVAHCATCQHRFYEKDLAEPSGWPAQRI